MLKHYALIAFLTVIGNILRAQENAYDSLNEDKWQFAASTYLYFVEDDKDVLTLLGYADYKRLHLESRYNYEERNTLSLFTGWRFEAHGRLHFSAIPMVGVVVGELDGIAPAVELEVTFKKFDYYSETEYVFDFSGKENNFLYTWGELGISPFESFRTGISYQRTILYETGLDVQTGIFASYSFWKLTTGLHLFNPFSSSDKVFIAMLSIDF